MEPSTYGFGAQHKAVLEPRCTWTLAKEFLEFARYHCHILEESRLISFILYCHSKKLLIHFLYSTDLKLVSPHVGKQHHHSY